MRAAQEAHQRKRYGDRRPAALAPALSPEPEHIYASETATARGSRSPARMRRPEEGAQGSASTCNNTPHQQRDRSRCRASRGPLGIRTDDITSPAKRRTSAPRPRALATTLAGRPAATRGQGRGGRRAERKARTAPYLAGPRAAPEPFRRQRERSVSRATRVAGHQRASTGGTVGKPASGRKGSER